jgi:DNA-binding response OmpR family regulator
LIIEDDYELGMSTVDVLEMLNYDTELIQNGTQAFDRIAACQPALVLLDIHLPGKSGLEILHEIRADARLSRLKVVVVSADALRADTVRDLADFVLLKPYSISQLGNLTSRLIPVNN